MNETSFAERLAERLAAVGLEDERQAMAGEVEMQERSERLGVLERECERLHRDLIRPRAEKLAASLDASITSFRTPTGFLTYVRFARTTRYPATAKLGLGVEWDGEGQGACLVCSVEILPVLMTLPGDARLALEWEGPDAAQAARWIEERIMLFLDAYLGIARDPNYQMDNFRSDPVCGMRVSVVNARATVEHQGKRYVFCSAACEARFAAAPEL